MIHSHAMAWECYFRALLFKRGNGVLTHFEVQEYLKRIGCEPNELLSRPRDLDLINHLIYAHSTHVPFENMDVLLKRTIVLDEQALWEKLVIGRRGGYCFEQNGLLMAILTYLGFVVEPLAARVRLNSQDRQELTTKTHLVLKVILDGQDYFIDSGVGSASLTQALPCVLNTVIKTTHDERRLEFEQGSYYHQIRYGDEWQDVCQFNGATMPLVDCKIANWYVSTSPDTHFTQQLLVAIANTDGSRTTLKNNLLTVRHQGNIIRQEYLAEPQQLLDVLLNTFGLTLTQAQLTALVAVIAWEKPA